MAQNFNLGTLGQVLAVNTAANSVTVNSALVIGTASANVTINGTSFSGTANNASYLGGTTASGYQTTAGLSANVATLAANSATYILANTGLVSNATGVYVNATYIGTLSANNASYLGGTAAASYVQNTDSRTLSGNLNFTGTNTYFTGVATHAANVYANGVLIVANTVATSIATGATANGSTQATAYPIVTTSVQFTTVASGTGAILPSSVAGQRVFIANDGANQLLLYPPVGGVIDQASTNAAVTIAAGGMWEGMSLTSVNWTSISPDTQGANGVVATQGNGVVTLTVNSAYINTISANAATYLNGKTEGNLNVNSAITSNTANTATYIIANTGLVSNATGVYVNATYIATLSANNASYLGGTAAASFVQNTDSRTLSGNLNFTGTNTYFTGVATHAANIIITSTSGISANGGYGTSGQALTTNGSAVYWSTIVGTNTSAQYTWSNTQTFQNTITFSSNILVGTTVNAASYSVGTNFIANTTQVTVAVPLSANGGTGTSGYILTSNGSTGSPYWAAAAGGGYYAKGGAATVGSASDANNIFRVNGQTLYNNTTIGATENAQCAGPLTVQTGITLTITTGGRVVIS